MADDWKEIDEELKKLEEEFSTDDESIRYLAEPSAADYWKKRMEEEKNLYSKMIDTREEEKKAMESRLSQQKEKIGSLQEQIKNLEQSISDESQAWQERLKAKETELMLEKQRVGWDEEMKKLQYEKKILEEEIERIKANAARDIDEVKARHKKESEELLSAQKEVMETLESLEREVTAHKNESEKRISEVTSEREKMFYEIELQRKKINELSSGAEKARLERDAVQGRIAAIAAKFAREKESLFEYMTFIGGSFSSVHRDYMGTVSGVISYCLSRMRIPRLARKQLAVATDTLDRIMQETERYSVLMRAVKPDLQDMYAERLITRLTDNTGTESLPSGLSIRVDFPMIRKALAPYTDTAEKIEARCSENSAETVFSLAITLPYRLVVDRSYVELRHAVFLHGWNISVSPESEKTVISLEIPSEVKKLQV